VKDIQTNYKKYLKYLLLVSIIFILDRLSKLYILNLAENMNLVDIYVNSYLNLYLVWNKGIAFGLFSFDKNYFYNFITILIIIVIFVIFIMIYKANDFKVYFLLLIISGALGNLFDRIYYTAVPVFIDFHINDIHWFIFNVADIFISIGVICLIFVEIFMNKESKNEIN
jgi:signal peptidase II